MLIYSFREIDSQSLILIVGPTLSDPNVHQCINKLSLRSATDHGHRFPFTSKFMQIMS